MDPYKLANILVPLFVSLYRAIKVCHDYRSYPARIQLSKDDVRRFVLMEDTVKYASISIVWLLIGFVALYYISTANVIPEIIGTGIHIPLVLAIVGLMIRETAKKLIKDKRNLEIIDKKTIIFASTIILSGCMLPIDWKLFLLIFAIILGKYIWVDFIFDYRGIIKRLKKQMQSNSINILIKLMNPFAFSFIMDNIVYESIFSFGPTWTKHVFMPIIYLIDFAYAWTFHKDRELQFEWEEEQSINKDEGSDVLQEKRSDCHR